MNTVITPRRIADLSFDLKNPRLPEFDLGPKADDDEVIRLLWNTMDVKELVLSIASSGFFPHEPVIVTEEGGKTVVIEGNRRLAAVRILLDRDLADELDRTLPSISDESRRRLQSIPTVLGTRRESWQYLGFKHVNGPAKWSSYAKSRYVAHVHETYGVSLNDIASQIGDTHKTVQRLFRGLMVIRQAETWKVFNRSDRWHRHFAFSHMYTGIGYPSVETFLGLKPDSEQDSNPVPSEKRSELGEFCTWLYGSKSREVLPVVGKQNPHLRYLAIVLNSPDGLAALRSGLDIEAAYELSRPSSTVFEESLLAAKRNLQKARGLLSSGYCGSRELLRIADAVANLADDLWEEMDRKSTPRRSRRNTGGTKT